MRIFERGCFFHHMYSWDCFKSKQIWNSLGLNLDHTSRPPLTLVFRANSQDTTDIFLFCITPLVPYFKAINTIHPLGKLGIKGLWLYILPTIWNIKCGYYRFSNVQTTVKFCFILHMQPWYLLGYSITRSKIWFSKNKKKNGYPRLQRNYHWFRLIDNSLSSKILVDLIRFHLDSILVKNCKVLSEFWRDMTYDYSQILMLLLLIL